MLSTFRDIIDLWGQPQALADEIGASKWAARKWHQRDAIPGEWWKSIARAAEVRGFSVSVEVMAEIASRKLGDHILTEAAE